MAHVWPYSKAIGSCADTGNDFRRGARVPLFDVPVDILKVDLRFE
jgi:hypothetical protein